MVQSRRHGGQGVRPGYSGGRPLRREWPKMATANGQRHHEAGRRPSSPCCLLVHLIPPEGVRTSLILESRPRVPLPDRHVKNSRRRRQHLKSRRERLASHFLALGGITKITYGFILIPSFPASSKLVRPSPFPPTSPS